MNERIRELYIQASEQFKVVQDQGLPAPYQTRAFAEKFAELIVRECAKRIDYWESKQGEHADDLLKHFGVEE